jgi:hypothetical protein
MKIGRLSARQFPRSRAQAARARTIRVFKDQLNRLAAARLQIIWAGEESG